MHLVLALVPQLSPGHGKPGPSIIALLFPRHRASQSKNLLVFHALEYIFAASLFLIAKHLNIDTSNLSRGELGRRYILVREVSQIDVIIEALAHALQGPCKLSDI